MKQLITLMTFLITLSVFAAQPAINTYGKGGSFISDPPRTDVAIKGYDTVAYFTDNMPVKGSDLEGSDVEVRFEEKSRCVYKGTG